MIEPITKDTLLTGRKEYKWVPFLYVSYACCVVVWMMFIPAEDSMKWNMLLLMTLVYIGALSGTAVRALQRIEERLDQL